MKTLFVQPLVTEKSMAHSSEGRYQFIVPAWATKPQIADAVTKQFGVTIVGVTTITIPGRKVTFQRHPGWQDGYKKAIVRLGAGQSINDFSLPVDAAGTSEKEPQASEQEPAPTPTQSKVTVRSKKRGA